jgi:hypothetical protein
VKRMLGLVLAGSAASSASALAVEGSELAHSRAEFSFTVAAPYETVVPLFGALRERVWAGSHWNPSFVYPETPRDTPGMVFTVDHGGRHATWINTALDFETGHVQYAYFLSDVLVTLIDIHVLRQDASHVLVRVAYERTALQKEANDHVRAMAEDDKGSGKEWEEAISSYLLKGSSEK